MGSWSCWYTIINIQKESVVANVYIKYAWVVPSKDKKGETFANTFQNIVKESKFKPNKIWVDKGSKFYRRFMKEWLKDENTGIYSVHNEYKELLNDSLNFKK